MKAIILAAGYATRLYPLTQDKAKPLLPVQGKHMINYIVEKLERCEQVNEIIVVTNEKFYEDFSIWKEMTTISKPLTIVNDKTMQNGTRLGAIGDIDFVIDQRKIDEDVVVIGGDNLFACDISQFLTFQDKKKTSVLAVHSSTKELIAGKLGCVAFDASKKVVEFEEKPDSPKSNCAATCCYVFIKEDFPLIKEALAQNLADRPGDLIKFLITKRPVHAFAFEGYWYDIGSLDQYEYVNKDSTQL